jgi:hypothetical protein
METGAIEAITSSCFDFFGKTPIFAYIGSEILKQYISTSSIFLCVAGSHD